MAQKVFGFPLKDRRGIVQVVTVAKFRRPRNPVKCNVHRFHVWWWDTIVSDQSQQPPTGHLCACGAIPWSHHPELDAAVVAASEEPKP